MRTMFRPGPTELVQRMFHVTTEVARETRDLNPPGEPLVRARSDIGPMVEFGVDLGKVFTYVDDAVARRWECSPDQLLKRSLQNLDDRAARIDQGRVSAGVMSGRSIRILRDRPRWASSLVLAPEHLFRLFGDHDQIIGAPSVSCLVSLPMDTPTRVVADIVVDLEIRALRPLWLDPFVIEDRQVVWSNEDDFEG